jgi:tetratricopeptide (TPR) repeat protein
VAVSLPFISNGLGIFLRTTASFLPTSLLLLLLAAPSWCLADTVFLQNGRKIEGRILARTNGELKVDLFSGGVVNLKEAEVDHVEERAPKKTLLDQASGLVEAAQYEKALKILDEGLDKSSKDEDIKKARDQVLGKLVEKAAKDAKKMAEAGKFDDIANLAGPLLKRLPEGAARSQSVDWFTRLYLEKVAQDIDHIRYADAAKTLAQANEMGIKDARMHLLLGTMHQQMGRWTLAGNEYQMALVMDPDLHDAKIALDKTNREISRLGLEKVSAIDKTKEMLALSTALEKKVEEARPIKKPNETVAAVVPPVLINQTEFQKIAQYIPKNCNQYDAIIERASQKYHVETAWIKAIIMQESSFNPKDKSPVGAKGLMQLMDGTAKEVGVKDSYDPEQNIMGGTCYFRDMLVQFKQDPILALAAYNAGPGAVTFYKGVPPYKETQGYVRRVPMYYQYFKFLEQVGK